MSETSLRPVTEYFPRALLTRFGEDVATASASALDAVARYVAALEAVPAGKLHAPLGPGKWTPIGFTEHLALVTRIYVADVSRVAAGGDASRHDPGMVDGQGRLVVTVPGAEPGPDRDAAVVVADLHAATDLLVRTVRAAVEGGHGASLVHVNPYFGELNPLGCLQLAAAHAHHHRKRHLQPLASASQVAP